MQTCFWGIFAVYNIKGGLEAAFFQVPPPSDSKMISCPQLEAEKIQDRLPGDGMSFNKEATVQVAGLE